MQKAEPRQRAHVRAIYSLLDPAALAELAHAAFGLRASGPLRLLYSGLNDHYSLPTGRGDYVLRVYRHGWRSDDDVLWELELVNHLSQRGAPVAAVLPCQDGRWFAELQASEGRRQVAMFEHARGPYTHFGTTGRSRISPALCAEAFGRSVAQIHQAADSYRPPSQRFALDLAELLERPLAAIARVYAGYPGELERLRERVAQLRQLLEPRLASADWGPCHGDMSGGNSTFWQDQVMHFDFDCGGPGWRAYDLGVFFWSLFINGHDADVWDPFLVGYRSQRALSAADQALVPAFAAARVIWLQGLWCANAGRFGRQALHADALERELGRFQALLARALQALGAG